MKRSIVFVFLTIVAMSLSAHAQDTNSSAPVPTYTVQPTDTGWELARRYYDDATTWRRIVDMNPTLQQPGRVTEKGGRIILLLKPGEVLVGLDRLGVEAPKAVPFEQLELPKPEPIVKVKNVQVPTPTTPTWMWWLLGLLVLFALVAWFVNRMLSKDPVRSGPPMIQGGVQETNLVASLQQVAARANGAEVRNSQDPSFYQQFTVLRSTPGRIWGVLNVRYADGKVTPRRLNGERAWEAEVELPLEPRQTVRRREVVYMLQGCGNDLRTGGVSRYLPGPGFRFEADPVVAPVASTATAVIPTTAVPAAPAMAIVPTVATAPTSATAPSVVVAPIVPVTTTSVTTIEPVAEGVVFEYKRATKTQPAMIRLRGVEAEDFVFTSGPDGTTLRYKETEKEVVVKK